MPCVSTSGMVCCGGERWLMSRVTSPSGEEGSGRARATLDTVSAASRYAFRFGHQSAVSIEASGPHARPLTGVVVRAGAVALALGAVLGRLARLPASVVLHSGQVLRRAAGGAGRPVGRGGALGQDGLRLVAASLARVAGGEGRPHVGDGRIHVDDSGHGCAVRAGVRVRSSERRAGHVREG